MDLIDALHLQSFDCVALVGGGGKSTIMYRIAAEAAARGLPVIVGGATRFTAPRLGAALPLVALSPAEAPLALVRDALKRSGAISVCGGHGDKGRLLPATLEQINAIAVAGLGMLVLEADGSRNRPFKAPGALEPVIPSSSKVVLSVVGLDAIGAALDERSVHRPELVSTIAGLALGAPITTAAVAAVLLSLDGGHKNLPPGARWVPMLNKAEPPREEDGRELARLLIDGGADCVVLATAADEPPVVDVVRKAG